MTPEQQRLAIEANLKEERKAIELHEAFERLSSNRDFKRIIKDGYFRDEAVRLVHLKAEAQYQTPDRQAAIVRSIDAIGELSDYFRVIKHQADNARKAIELGEVQLEELAREELAE